ncbi:MAG: trigger factor [Bacteroidota bacterium]|nr:trigger factor [Bacteroidota bacterium]
MNFNITDINETEKEVEIIVLQEELIPHFENAYQDYRKKIDMPGFRKGKVPLDKIKKLYGESIEYESLEKIANDSFQKNIEEQKIDVVGTPTLVDMNYKKGEEATFKIKYDVIPNFDLKNYKGLKYEKLVHNVTEGEFEDQVNQILFANAERSEAKTADDNHHVVTFDLQDLDEGGLPLIGKVAKNETVYLADKHVYPEFKNALKNVSVNETRITDFDYEHDGHKHKQKSQLVVNKIQKVVLPELTDEFVKKITKDAIVTVDDFKKHLRENLQTEWQNHSESKLINAIVEKIVASHEFVVPASLMEGVLNSFVEDIKQRFPNKELPKEFNIEEFKKHQKERAIWQAKWFLIREQIIKAENIQVEDSDIEERVDADVMRTGIDRERLLEYYKKAHAINDGILSVKLNKFLIANNEIEEIVTEKEI